MYSLAEDKKIDIDKSLLDLVSSLNLQKPNQESTSVKIRERYQYGIDLSLDDKTYNELLSLCRKILSKTKEIIEE